MTVEIISLTISRKVRDQAEIKLVTFGSAVRLATNCVTGPVLYKGTGMSLTCGKYFHVMRPLFYTTSDRSNATAKFQAKKQLSPI